jgi:hypothetical protein
VVRRLLSLVLSVLVLCVVMPSVRVAAQPAPAPVQGEPEEALDRKIAVWRFDALGIDETLVSRLETLFRMELDRLNKQPLPSRREIERVITAEQRECTGEDKCLSAIGKKLGVEIVVTGTVGAMGDSYVLNIKAVETATAKQLPRIQTDPLRGSPDDLIEGVRVAAYKLLAPDQLYGAIQIQSDLVGAEVKLDGKLVGKTPIPNLGLIPKQKLGKHQLRVEAKGYQPFEDEVDVQFQKVRQVVVRLLPSAVTGTGQVVTVERRPFYTKTWFIVGVGVAAIVAGAIIGYEAGRVNCVDARGNAISC